MARSDLLISLVKAGTQGNQPAFQRTVEAIVAEERSRQHHVVADRLEQFLEKAQPSRPAPAAGRLEPGLCHEVVPQRLIDDLVLPPLVKSASCELIEEQQRADLLRSHALEPRHRMLLIGVPGNGKTSLAEAIAGELALPLLVVRYDAVIGSYLGETASRLARLFEYVRTRRCVLFFDEFDTLGKERGDTQETGEIKRVVSSLLLSVDALPSYVVIVAATNHPELLDRAVWRRFQLRLELPLPGPAERKVFIEKFESRTNLEIGFSTQVVRERLAGMSYAEIEELCMDIRRRVILAGSDADIKAITRLRLAHLPRPRRVPTNSDSPG
jgi:SpoVK/Ycf46/Vps4 family AAA+-type ATPase